MDIDLITNTLVLLNEKKEIIFSSTKGGIRPLVECIQTIKENNHTLHDRVIGLAAAKLIVYSKAINKVITPTISKPAKEYLEENNIELKYTQVVDNILMKDRTDICPMEKKALTANNNDDFIKEIFELFNKLKQ